MVRKLEMKKGTSLPHQKRLYVNFMYLKKFGSQNGKTSIKTHQIDL